MTGKSIKLLCWVLLFMTVLTTGTSMMTAQSDMLAVSGIILIAAFIVVSVKTRCFIKLNFNNPKNKDKTV